jgi:AcrR family transcriptional regulator
MSIRDERKQQSRQALLDAALKLTISGRSFSAISLREITRAVGLVPAAFYRHFQNLDQLAEELIDQLALQLRSLQHQFHQIYFRDPQNGISRGLEYFLSIVEQQPEIWIFLIAERWGGSNKLRQAIAREIDFLIQDFAQALQHLDHLRQYNAVDPEECYQLATVLINLSFTWAMTWITLDQQDPSPTQQSAKQQLHAQIEQQIKLIFRGRLRGNRPIQSP